MSEPLGRFEPPHAPAELRERVMARARGAVEAGARPTKLDQVWFSTGWRLIWAAAFAFFVLLDVFVMRSTGGLPVTPSGGSVDSETAAAASAVGLSGRGWTGASVAVNDDNGSSGAIGEAL